MRIVFFSFKKKKVGRKSCPLNVPKKWQSTRVLLPQLVFFIDGRETINHRRRSSKADANREIRFFFVFFMSLTFFSASLPFTSRYEPASERESGRLSGRPIVGTHTKIPVKLSKTQ